MWHNMCIYIYIYSIRRIKICCISNQYTIILSIQHTSLYTLIYPIGSMYGIYAKIGDILMVNVTIYSIHGSYGHIYIYTHYIHVSYMYHAWGGFHKIHSSLSQPDHSNWPHSPARCGLIEGSRRSGDVGTLAENPNSFSMEVYSWENHL